MRPFRRPDEPRPPGLPRRDLDANSWRRPAQTTPPPSHSAPVPPQASTPPYGQPLAYSRPTATQSTRWQEAPPVDRNEVQAIAQAQKQRQADPWADRKVDVAEDPFADMAGGSSNWRPSQAVDREVVFSGGKPASKRSKPERSQGRAGGSKPSGDVRLEDIPSHAPPNPDIPSTYLPAWAIQEMEKEAKRQRSLANPGHQGKGRKGRPARNAPPPPVLDPPVRDITFLCTQEHNMLELTARPGSQVKQWTNMPKSFLTTYLNNTYGRRIEFTYSRRGPQDGTVHTVTVDADPQSGLMGVGEAMSKKDAERAATFDACCKLEERSLTRRGRGRVRGFESGTGPAEVTANGEVIPGKPAGVGPRQQIVDFAASLGHHIQPEYTGTTGAGNRKLYHVRYTIPLPPNVLGGGTITAEGSGRNRKAAEEAAAVAFKKVAEDRVGCPVLWTQEKSAAWTLEVARNWLVYYERHRSNVPSARLEVTRRLLAPTRPRGKPTAVFDARVWVDVDANPGGLAQDKLNQKEATDEAWLRAGLLLRHREAVLWDRYIARRTGKTSELAGGKEKDRTSRIGLLDEGPGAVDPQVAEDRLRSLLQGLRDVYGEDLAEEDLNEEYALVESSDDEDGELMQKTEGVEGEEDGGEGRRRWVRSGQEDQKPGAPPAARAGRAAGRAMNTRQRAPPVPEDPARNQALKASWDRYKESQAGQKMMEARHRLPMVQHADELMKAVRESPVVVLVGQTGCGKTTQVPQLLLEDAINQGRGSSCRILCTQPRRLAAISVAERVARERGERVGSTAGVGYTVRFDARPPHPGGGTVQYCTTGVLLRRLHGAEGLEGVSHVVVDEVHERDMGVDFLLVVLRRLLASRVEAGLPAVKVILMSATVETGLFASYFSRVCGGQPAPIVRVPGRTFPVTRHLLGEVVEEMRERWGHRDVDRLLRAQDTSKYVDRELRVMSPAGSASVSRVSTPVNGMRRSGTDAEDDVIMITDSDDEDARSDRSDGPSEAGGPVQDIRRTGGQRQEGGVAKWMKMTPQEMREEAEVPYSLIAMSVAHIIRGVEERRRQKAEAAADPANAPDAKDDEPDQGAILVFLPGWEEMSRVQRILQQDRPLGLDMSNESIYHIHLLHSSIPSKTQHLVFDPVPAGEWKIILATNIAETSITIDDVVWVVDSGKIREKRYDPATRITHLVTAWVSESSARQRAGRAGRVRPGHYYGCMSQGRYARLDPYGTPEMVRSDLQEICLHIRALELPGGSAAQLLAEALEPPDPSAVAAALANLRALRALDGEERLTPLGRVLATLPVEPTLGRMVLQGVVMRALDPALTLAAAMAGKDPFAGPAWKRQEGDAARSRWSRGTRSDLLAIAQVYEPWVEMMHAHGSVGRFHSNSAPGRPPPGEVIRFCEEESLGWQSLQAIDRTKTQLLDVLRRAGVLQAAMRHFPAPPPGTSRRKGLFLGPPELNSNSHSPALLRSLILSGVYPNVAIQRGDGRRKKDAGCVTRHVRWSLVHPSSVNSRRQLERADDAVASRSMDNDVSGSNGSVYVFSEVVQSAPAPGGGGGGGMSILRQTTRVSPATTLLFGGVVEEEMTPQGSLELLMDGWLRISGISPNIPAPSALVSRSSVLLALAAQVKWQMDRAFEKTFADMMCGPGESGSGEKSLFTQGHLVKLLIQTLEALDVRDGKD